MLCKAPAVFLNSPDHNFKLPCYMTSGLLIRHYGLPEWDRKFQQVHDQVQLSFLFIVEIQIGLGHKVFTGVSFCDFSSAIRNKAVETFQNALFRNWTSKHYSTGLETYIDQWTMDCGLRTWDRKQTVHKMRTSSNNNCCVAKSNLLLHQNIKWWHLSILYTAYVYSMSLLYMSNK